jgi:hypothetical protein
MKDYLAYVRGSPQYNSEFKPAPFEWREDVPDGMEVSSVSTAPNGSATQGSQRQEVSVTVGDDSMKNS